MRFRILGPLEVAGERGEIALRGAKERAVLAYLLLHARRAVAVDELVDRLWGEEPPESARKSLQVRVAGLRKALDEERIVTRGSGYLLRIEPGELDLELLEQTLADADRADPATADRLLGEALALWRGPALADFRYETWAQPAIVRLEELRLLAQERQIDAALRLGRHEELVGQLEVLVAEHPLRERLRAQLMIALYRAGRQVEALDVFQRTRRMLVEELGLEPGAELTDLQTAILGHDPALALRHAEVGARSILVAALEAEAVDPLLALAEPLAASPRRDVVLVRPTAAPASLDAVTANLLRRTERLAASGIVARAAAFTSSTPAADIIRLATIQDVDLLLVDASPGLLDDVVQATVLTDAPCDVGIVTPGKLGTGPVLVPFTGAAHDWTAVEIGAWLARTLQVALRLAGPREGARDSSRLLADASLAVQRALDIAAAPLLVDSSPDGLVEAAGEAMLVVVGLGDRWRTDGLGPTRTALAERAERPVLLVRGGLRPGGLAPRESYTRFTWTIRPT